MKRKLFFLFFMAFSSICYADPSMHIFVSVPPLKYIVKSIGGSNVTVHTMVRPGYSPETYSPTPRQMQMLRGTTVYFRMGVPFEKAWLQKIRKSNEDLHIIDLRKNLHLHRIGDELDPHVWNDPVQVMKMAKTILKVLLYFDSDNEEYYVNKYRVFHAKLANLNRFVKSKLAPFENRIMLVYHPAWAYFAKRYHLRQIAIEKDGKGPGPQDMEHIVQMARDKKIKTIFISPQHNKKHAKTIANAIGAKIVVINPLARNYLKNMYRVAKKINRAFKKRR